jgi:leucyl aminopeptidase
MQFSVKVGVRAADKIECAILPLFDGGTASSTTAAFDRAIKGRIRLLIRRGDASASLGQAFLLRDVKGAGARNILLIGCGPRSNFRTEQLVRAAAVAAETLGKTSLRSATSFLGFDADSAIDAYSAARAVVQGTRFANYRFTEQKSSRDAKPGLGRIAVAVALQDSVADAKRGIAHAKAIADGIDLARDLGNRSPNVCTPVHLASVARDLGREHSALTVKILGEPEIKRLGMGAFLSVTAGSANPPRLIVMQYRGAASSVKPVVLCGKGVTFDTGGISLKPPPKMDEMKFDMCGAAAVIGTMASVALLKLKANVVAIVPACENMPGGRATRPGDIVTSMSGQTIEILNTDAEGRLILCDALTYAKQFKPACIIDVATLTGACVIALGGMYSGLFSSDEALGAALAAAGRRANDEAWPLPVRDEYGESLRSNFADFANAGAREGGASIAAQFLSRFVDDTPWAHLDIAGVAWLQGNAKGATGRPVGLLVDFLLDRQVS